MNLKIRGEVLVLHGEVHGALETRVASIHHLLREPIQSFLHIYVVVRIVQIFIAEP